MKIQAFILSLVILVISSASRTTPKSLEFEVSSGNTRDEFGILHPVEPGGKSNGGDDDDDDDDDRDDDIIVGKKLDDDKNDDKNDDAKVCAIKAKDVARKATNQESFAVVELRNQKEMVVVALQNMNPLPPAKTSSLEIVHGEEFSYALVNRVDHFMSWSEDAFEKFSQDQKPEQGFEFETSKSLVAQLSKDENRLTEYKAHLYELAWRKCMRSRRIERSDFTDYQLGKKFGVGGQGEVWQAVRKKKSSSPISTGTTTATPATNTVITTATTTIKTPTLTKAPSPEEEGNDRNQEEEIFVLKRVFVERGDDILLSGIREQVFGKRLQNHVEIARFVEAFNRTTTKPDGSTVMDMWLVFHHEGNSLNSLLYSQVEAGSTTFLERSALWQRMRRDLSGSMVRRELLRQILQGMVVVQKANIAHRDLKPSNILISQNEDDKSGFGFRAKISDFGSAFDTKHFSLNARLYPKGPTENEETKAYRPPEAFLSSITAIPFPYLATDHAVESFSRKLPYHAFDSWSIGIIALEMLLGTCSIFELQDSREKAKIDHELARVKYLHPDEDSFRAVKEMRYNLKALELFGIGPDLHDKEKFKLAVRKRDPLSKGFYFEKEESKGESKLRGDNELDFVMSLLHFSAYDRPTAAQALEHPYFQL